MQTKGVYLAVSFIFISSALAQENDEPYNEASGTSIINILSAVGAATSSSSSSRSQSSDLSYPYEGYMQSLYDTFVAPQPSLGISVNTRALLGPQVELLKLAEDFFILSGDVLRRVGGLFNDNYDLIRALVNLGVNKASKIQNFTLSGIAILRKVLEFALHLFSDFSLTIPSITLGSMPSEFAHAVYGVPPVSDSTNTTLF